MDHFPHNLYLTSKIHSDIEILKKISDTILLKKKNVSFKKYLSQDFEFNAPNVCFHCFEYLRENKIKKNISFTALCSCSRNESFNISSLSRLNVFFMREIVFFGTNIFVERKLNQSNDFLINLLMNLKINFRVISGSDLFFENVAKSKKKYQSAMKLLI